jgi:hypothetical protein
VGALGHYLEEEGIATTQISLVREHTAAIRPPRALWVPFILGRPFGAPNDAAFQRRVLLAALRLLEAPAGPVLEDFPEEAPEPDADADAEPFACPVSFAGPEDEDDAAAMQREIAELAPWHDIAQERRGRTTVALSGLPVKEAARYIAEFIANPQVPAYRQDLSRGLALRLACEDVKAFYLEAASAQPGERAAQQAQDWFWRDTAAARMLRKLQAACLAGEDASARQFAENNLIPRAVKHAPPAARSDDA